MKNRPSVSGLYGLYAVVFTRPRDLPTFFLSLYVSFGCQVQSAFFLAEYFFEISTD